MFKECVYLGAVCRCTTVAVHLNICVQFSNHICSVVYFKYVYSAHCHMVDCIDFICGSCMHIHLSYKSIKYLVYMACMPNLMDIFVSSTYLAITWEVWIAVGCILAHVQNVGSVFSLSMMVVWLTHAMWQSYLLSNLCLHGTHAIYRDHFLYRALYWQMSQSSVFIYI